MNSVRQRERASLRKLGAVAGVLIIAFFVMIEAVHSHPGLTENDHCPVCAAAHVSATAPALPVLPVLAWVHVALVLYAPRSRGGLAVRRADCRPPPAIA